MELKNDRYTYHVFWSDEDDEHVGICLEFPSLSWLESTPELALQGIRKVVASVIADLAVNGETIPKPLSAYEYSGDLTIHIQPEVHRQLALEAVAAGISLNGLVNARLSQPG